jgi:predicted dehydrogenase
VQKIRVAVIGLGKMGLLHAGILASMNDVELVALCDQKKLLIKIAKKVFKERINVVNNIQALSDFDLDAVYVTTPIPTHYRVIESIYSGNIARNVFVEKTLAWHFDEAEKLCLKSKEIQGANMVGYQKRYGITFTKAFALLKEETIGELKNFKAYAYSSDFVGIGKEQAATIFASRGGVLRDLGSHAISLALWYFGNMQIIKTQENSDNEQKNGETIGFRSKAGNLEGFIEASWCKEGYRMPETGVNIEGSEGRLLVNDDKIEVQLKNGALKRWYRQDLDDNVDFVLWSPEYFREDRHFVKCVLDGQVPSPDFIEALKVDQIIAEVTKK